MSRPVADAVSRVARRPRVVLAVAALNLLVSLVASLPVAVALAPITDERPAAARLLGPDDGLAAELLYDHRHLALAAAASAVATAAVYGVWAWVLAGGLLAAFSSLEEERAIGARAIAAAAAREAGRMIAIGLLGLPLRLPALAATVGAGFALKWIGDRYDLAHVLGAAAPMALGIGAAWTAATVAIDAARGAARARPALSTVGSVLAGVRAVGRGPRAALPVMALGGGGFVALTASWHALAHPIPIAPAWGFGLLAVLALGLAVARAALAVAALLAGAALAAPVEGAQDPKPR